MADTTDPRALVAAGYDAVADRCARLEAEGDDDVDFVWVLARRA